MKFYFKISCCFLALVVTTMYAYAHSINYALQGAADKDVVWYYVQLGFRHIIPTGADHILFIVGLCLLCNNIKAIIWQATAFTIAHSVTLALAMKNIIVAPPAIVEPIISLSILFVAVENLLTKKLSQWRVLLVFMFGLLHGMGFASSLNETGLPPGRFVTSMVAFNAGVEIGQVAIILATFWLLITPFKNKPWYRERIVYGVSALIALVALYWTVERVITS